MYQIIAYFKGGGPLDGCQRLVLADTQRVYFDYGQYRAEPITEILPRKKVFIWEDYEGSD